MAWLFVVAATKVATIDSPVIEFGAAMPSRNCRDLIAWQRAVEFTIQVYEVSRAFPPDERFSLTAQIRRSATSVPSNIAEGEGRFSKADFERFLSIAHGSLRETETHVVIAMRLGYIASDAMESVLQQAQAVGRLIRGLANSLES